MIEARYREPKAEPIVKLTITLTMAQYEALRELARGSGKSYTKIVLEQITALLNRSSYGDPKDL